MLKFHFLTKIRGFFYLNPPKSPMKIYCVAREI